MMSKNISISLCFFVTLFMSINVLSDETISGSHAYQVDGEDKTVDLSGLEWMRLDTADTGQLNRTQMEKAFNDSSSIFYGWRYATRKETANLLRSLGTEYNDWSENNLAGITWFFEKFGIGPKVYREGEVMDGFVGWDFAYGEELECNKKNKNYGCRGIIGLVHYKSGLMYERWGADSTYERADSMQDRFSEYSEPNENISHLLVRQPN